MKYIQRQDRTQTHVFPVSLDESVDKDNEVRLIDLFIDSLDLGKYDFKVNFKENGRPAYQPSDLLKLYIYGYMNKIRSSRDFEKECKRNIEVIWLLKGLHPDYNTISNFRRDNSKSIKKVFRATVKLAQSFNLIGGKLIGGDSTKLRAQNFKKNNYNKKKIEQHLAYINDKLADYENQLSSADKNTEDHINQNIDKHKQRKQEYKELQNQLESTGEKKISTKDPESRQMIVRNNITEVAYNVQTTVDSENNILIDYKITNTNDSKAMGGNASTSKDITKEQ